MWPDIKPQPQSKDKKAESEWGDAAAKKKLSFGSDWAYVRELCKHSRAKGCWCVLEPGRSEDARLPPPSPEEVTAAPRALRRRLCAAKGVAAKQT